MLAALAPVAAVRSTGLQRHVPAPVPSADLEEHPAKSSIPKLFLQARSPDLLAIQLEDHLRAQGEVSPDLHTEADAAGADRQLKRRPEVEPAHATDAPDLSPKLVIKHLGHKAAVPKPRSLHGCSELGKIVGGQTDLAGLLRQLSQQLLIGQQPRAMQQLLGPAGLEEGFELTHSQRTLYCFWTEDLPSGQQRHRHSDSATCRGRGRPRRPLPSSEGVEETGAAGHPSTATLADRACA
mmetsp:Transcript_67480/g.197373  ORF Transcript_67480/g.197373 Transcript_67480/m.197373 type:complete len:238 (+) Transcript_67480:130-843(+)